VARVIDDPTGPDSDDFAPGEVLVASTVDPGWAPLLAVAGAVVLDIGGELSHGAMVARELGIPCVVNVKSGTRLIESGDVVCVDGSDGTVSVVDAEPAATA
jgi:pyruvate,water dikinase